MSHQRLITFLLTAVGTLLFIVAQVSLASTNAQIDAVGDRETTIVDIAGYERTLTQRMLAMSLLMQRYQRTGKALIAPQAELVGGEHDFDVALRALQQGGETPDSSGVRVALEPLARPEEKMILRKVSSLWQALRARIDALGDVVPKQVMIHALVETALSTTVNISGLMNDLSGEIRRVSARDIASLSQRRDSFVWLTMLGLLAIVLGFFLQVVKERRRVKGRALELQQRNAVLEASRSRYAHLTEAVRQGLFLIDANFIIQQEYSRELERIFRTDTLKGANIADVLRRLLPEKFHAPSRDYLAMLFNPAKREREVHEANPLEEVEVNFPDAAGGLLTRCLSFSFRRIIEEQRVAYVFGSVSDVTDKVALERGQREAERRTQRRLELLMSFLHVDSDVQAEFLAAANEQLREMNDVLRAIVLTGNNGQHDDVLRHRLETVLGCVRKLKNNAAQLRIEYFRKTAEAFENKISELRKRGSLSAEDFLVIAVLQAELRSDLEESQELSKRLLHARAVDQIADTAFVRKGSLSAQEEHEVTDAGSQVLTSLAAFTVDFGHQLGKEVRLDATAFQLQGLEVEQRRLLKDVLTQVIRNSVAHGIEEPEVRVAMGKSALGAIIFRNVPAAAGCFAFSCHDDGRGIDVDAVRRDAIAQGLLHAEDADDIDDSMVARLIFHPGFSTAKEGADGAPERGMGMDLIRKVVVERLGGEITLSSQPGEFFELGFTIPMRKHSSARV